MSKYKPGDIVTIKGTEFAVLDVEKGTAKDGKDKMFVLLKEPVGSEKFDDNRNDYMFSALRKVVNKWFENYTRELRDQLIYPREVSLLTMDGRADYGNRVFSAAPLTFDEYRKYSKFIPDCDKASWLVTGWGAPIASARRSCWLCSPMAVGGGTKCSYSYAVRPAMWVSEELIDTPEKPDLSEYSTMALLKELAEREKRNG